MPCRRSPSSTFAEPSKDSGRPAPAACSANAQTLCLNGNRFQLTVDWAVPSQGRTGTGTAVPITSDTGYFWFFNSANVELVFKVIDGRHENNAFWVFWGAATNVAFTATVTDTTNSDSRVYQNALGDFASGGDIEAFPQ